MVSVFFSETMRKYPTIPILMRTCCAPYKMPDDSGLVLEEDVRVMIPVYAIHHDPNYYPDPEKFDPERFSPERKSSIPPYTFFPFGEGPRICIGRFSNKLSHYCYSLIIL